MDFRIVIPARYASSRLPGKPLIDLCGKSMIRRVYERAAPVAPTIVATDDIRIADHVHSFGGAAVFTDAHLASGTDRVAQAALLAPWLDDTIVVNVQGDQPLIDPAMIVHAAEMKSLKKDADVVTLHYPIYSKAEFEGRTTVKLVADPSGRVLLFSRAPIPVQYGEVMWQTMAYGQKHIGIYAYTVAGLRRFAAATPSVLEETEKLEQLRALEIGMKIYSYHAPSEPKPEVNIDDDVDAVKRILRGNV